jgi:hypothetical protein
MIRISLSIFMLLLSLSGMVFAQSDASCLDLDAEDCALFEMLQANTTMPESTAMRVSITGDLAADDETAAFAVDVYGAYTTDEAAAEAAIDTFESIALLDLSPRDMLNLLEGLVSAWDAELSFDLSAIPEAQMFLGGETIDLYVVDGVAYINSPLLALAMDDPTIEGVYGIDVFEALDYALADITVGDLGLFESMEELGGPRGVNQGFNEAFMDSFNQFSASQNFTEADFADFVTLTRLEDETFEGETVAVFASTVDIAGMLAAPAIRDAMNANMNMQGMGDPEMEAQMAEMMNEMFDGLAASLAGSTVTVVQKWGLDTGYLVGADMALDVMLDVDEMNAAMGMPTDDDDVATFNLDIRFTLEDVNQIDAIDLPADAQIVPLSALLNSDL